MAILNTQVDTFHISRHAQLEADVDVRKSKISLTKTSQAVEIIAPSTVPLRTNIEKRNAREKSRICLVECDRRVIEILPPIAPVSAQRNTKAKLTAPQPHSPLSRQGSDLLESELTDSQEICRKACEMIATHNKRTKENKLGWEKEIELYTSLLKYQGFENNSPEAMNASLEIGSHLCIFQAEKDVEKFSTIIDFLKKQDEFKAQLGNPSKTKVEWPNCYTTPTETLNFLRKRAHLSGNPNHQGHFAIDRLIHEGYCKTAVIKSIIFKNEV